MSSCGSMHYSFFIVKHYKIMYMLFFIVKHYKKCRFEFFFYNDVYEKS